MNEHILLLLLILATAAVYGQPRSAPPRPEERSRFLNLLQQTRSAVAACADPEARRLLRQAEEKAGQIPPQRQRGGPPEMRALYADATRLLLRALDLCSESQHGTGAAETGQEFRQLREQIDALRTAAQQHPGQGRRPMLNKIQALERQARQALEAGQPAVARRKMELARILIHRLDRPGPARETVRQELTALHEEIGKMRGTGAAATPRREQLLNAAANQAADAEHFLGQQRLRPALAALAAGKRFVTLAAAVQPAAAEPGAAGLHAKITMLDEELDALEAEADDDPDHQEDLRLCRRACDKAQQALDNQQPELAREYLQLARDMMSELAL
ncbi:MAG TPA: hypothetical protein PKI62_08170 [bacterium]|nr:hypothetical protein [bacterium]